MQTKKGVLGRIEVEGVPQGQRSYQNKRKTQFGKKKSSRNSTKIHTTENFEIGLLEKLENAIKVLVS